jgi:hypothetical protein
MRVTTTSVGQRLTVQQQLEQSTFIFIFLFFCTLIHTYMLTRVELSSSAYLNCLCHALSTEKEEVMGLLLGDCEVNLQIY